MNNESNDNSRKNRDEKGEIKEGQITIGNKGIKMKMIKINNRLIYLKNIEKTRTDRVDKEKIYKASYRDAMVVEAVVKPHYRANGKKGNGIKIASLVNKIKIKAKEIKDNGFSRTEVYYKDILQPNRLIQEGEKCEKTNFYILKKVKKK